MRKEIKTIGVIILSGSILLCWGLFLPYFKAWEVGALELFAKNHLEYGFQISKGLPIINILDGNANYSTSHPPLVPLLISLSFKVFGIHEWSARIISVAFSLLGLVSFYLLLAYIADQKIALLATFFMIFMPMFNYYGRIVNYESVTLGLSLIFLYLFIKFIRTSRPVFASALVFVTILGILSDWPFCLLLLSLVLYMIYKRKGITTYFGLIILTFVVIASIFLLFKNIAQSSLNIQFGQLLYRCQHHGILLNIRFYQVLMKRFLLNFTPCSGLFLLLWLLIICKRKLQINDEVNLIACVLLLFGFGLPLIIPQAAYVHVWTLQYLTPAMALISALVVIKLKKKWRVVLMTLFIIFSLSYFAKLHIFRFSGPYQAGMQIAERASPRDILYTNAVSPVSFYSGVETYFFDFGLKKQESPEVFIEVKLPAFVCIIKYAVEPQFDYIKITDLLRQKEYKLIYDKNGVELWAV